MELFYHGSSALFDKFDLSHALEGDGKTKFGFGVYVSQTYRTAAHYSASGSGKTAPVHYVYTVEVPEMTADNHLWSGKPVNPAIVKRAEEKLGVALPEELAEAGKLFRKYIGNYLIGKKGTVKNMIKSASLEAEKAATAFFPTIGVEMYVWPRSQNKPDGEQNRAILVDSKVRVVKIESVELDKDEQLVAGTEKEVKL